MTDKIAKLWANKIKAGDRTIDEVPAKLLDKVKALLEEN